MKLKHLVSIFLFSLLNITFAQIPYSNSEASEFIQPYSMSGLSGAGVCYNPNKKLYYAAFIDGEDSPLEVYNNNYNFLYSGPIKAEINSIWYNPKTDKLEGILANNKGLFSIDLNADGIPYQINFIKTKFDLPGGRNGAAFNANSNEIYYVVEGTLYIQSLKNSKKKKLILEGFALNGYVEDAPIYTGVKGYEIGLLGYGENKLYLFDLKTGKQSAQVNLGFGAELIESHNIGYTNNTLFIFSSYTYYWDGFKIFK